MGRGNAVFVGIKGGLLVGTIGDVLDGFDEQAAKIIAIKRMAILDFILSLLTSLFF